MFWCPIGLPHDWSVCVYAHNYQDARRDPAIGYGSTQCPHWVRKSSEARDLEYNARCPRGVGCAYAHGAKERLYHPHVFRTSKCEFSRPHCPRGPLCAFFHEEKQRRVPAAAPGRDVVSNEELRRLQQDFLQPPFGPDPDEADEWLETEWMASVAGTWEGDRIDAWGDRLVPTDGPGEPNGVQAMAGNALPVPVAD